MKCARSRRHAKTVAYRIKYVEKLSAEQFTQTPPVGQRGRPSALSRFRISERPSK